jgi:hypothetical protein
MMLTKTTASKMPRYNPIKIAGTNARCEDTTKSLQLRCNNDMKRRVGVLTSGLILFRAHKLC